MSTPKVMELVDAHTGRMICTVSASEHFANIKPQSGGKLYRAHCNAQMVAGPRRYSRDLSSLPSHNRHPASARRRPQAAPPPLPNMRRVLLRRRAAQACRRLQVRRHRRRAKEAASCWALSKWKVRRMEKIPGWVW
jgi:hypothetical protein